MLVKKFTEGLLVTLAVSLTASAAGNSAIAPAAPETGSKTVVIWRNPVDITTRNLYYGPGGKAHEPRGRFTFVKEDLDGTNPKFVVRDQQGVKWKVKMGIEARPETVASRVAWAVGYYTDEDYFVANLHVHGMPARLHRGQKMVEPDGWVRNVRMKREEDKKGGTWEWRSNPFAGTREWNGLRVMMALMNNWDLKDANNKVRKEDGESVYMVSDLGASFGSASRTFPKDKSKGYLPSYETSKFLVKATDDTVTFRTPGRPTFVYFVNPKEYFSRVHMEWIGKDIPRADARWIGHLLARLSTAQLREAFRAAGYSPAEIDGYTWVLENRIAQISDL